MRKEAVIQVMLAEDEKERAAESVKAQAADSGRTVADMEQLDSGQTVTGILEVMADGFGFIRSDHYLPGEHDVYVSPVSYTHLDVYKRQDQKSIGFNADIRDKRQENVGELLRNALPEDFIKFGMIPEFMGSVPISVSLDPLSRCV